MPALRSPPTGVSDAEIGELQALLDALPAPLDPLDASALDGFIAAVALLRPPVAEARWLPFSSDAEGRAPPSGFDSGRLHDIARRRRLEIDAAIEARKWFDPWVFELDAPASPSQAVAAWVAGFALGSERFGVLADVDPAAAIDALALLYRHLDPDDLEDAAAIETAIAELGPPADLGDAVEDLVCATLLLADLTRPLLRRAQPAQAKRRARAPR